MGVQTHATLAGRGRQSYEETNKKGASFVEIQNKTARMEDEEVHSEAPMSQ